MEARKLACKTRDERGKNAAGRLRRSGFVPGNLIHDGKSVPIAFDETAFGRLVKSGLRSSSLLSLDVEGGDQNAMAVVQEVQRHPVSGRMVHVDFYQLQPGRVVRFHIPIEATGNSIGVKGGGAMEQYLRSLTIKAKPESVIETITVDITNLDVGDSIHLKDLKLPADWEVLVEGNPIVLMVARSRMILEDEKPAAGAEGAAAAPAAGAAAAAPEKK